MTRTIIDVYRTGIRPHGAWEYVITVEFKLEDLWVGAFWKRSGNAMDVWVCILPCVPIHWSGWRLKEPREAAEAARSKA